MQRIITCIVFYGNFSDIEKRIETTAWAKTFKFKKLMKCISGSKKKLE
jgi:hypothetical protein